MFAGECAGFNCFFKFFKHSFRRTHISVPVLKTLRWRKTNVALANLVVASRPLHFARHANSASVIPNCLTSSKGWQQSSISIIWLVKLVSNWLLDSGGKRPITLCEPSPWLSPRNCRINLEGIQDHTQSSDTTVYLVQSRVRKPAAL